MGFGKLLSDYSVFEACTYGRDVMASGSAVGRHWNYKASKLGLCLNSTN